METSTVIYQGELRTLCTHSKSLNKVTTDAPTDNQGKGEAFSPTDLMATSLATCMLTIMGIRARDNKLNLEGTEASVEKIMAENPRRVAGININIKFPTNNFTDTQREMLEDAAINCPVAKSLSPDIRQNIRFEY